MFGPSKDLLRRCLGVQIHTDKIFGRLGYILLGGGFNFFYFHPYLGKIPILTDIFQRCWNHQQACLFAPCIFFHLSWIGLFVCTVRFRNLPVKPGYLDMASSHNENWVSMSWLDPPKLIPIKHQTHLRRYDWMSRRVLHVISIKLSHFISWRYIFQSHFSSIVFFR